MDVLLRDWSFEPVAVLALAVAVWHEVGLRALLRRTRRDRVGRRRRRSLWFYASVLVLLVALLSPLEQQGYHFFYVRTIQHLLLMFAAPVLLVAGAPWQPLLLGVPLRVRRRVLPRLLHGPRARPLRAGVRALVRPPVAVGLFNLVMVVTLLPPVVDFTERHRPVHIWLHNGSMLASGVLFWLLIVSSPPLRTVADPLVQVIALLFTNIVMFVLAMSMTFFTHHPWFSVYAHAPGASISQLGDQQVGAGILWVCGDLWAVPPLVIAAYRLFTREAGAVEASFERLLGARRGVPVGRGPAD